MWIIKNNYFTKRLFLLLMKYFTYSDNEPSIFRWRGRSFVFNMQGVCMMKDFQ